MTWSDFYLICFAVGFCFSFFSFVFGDRASASCICRTSMVMARAFAGGPRPVAACSGRQAAGVSGSAWRRRRRMLHMARTVSPFNPPSIAAFLAWFGGTGYLLTRFSAFWVGIGAFAVGRGGLVGGAIIFFFLTKVLMSDQEYLDPADFEMVGVLGKLSVPIREGGTGELIYSQMGTRRVCGARSDDGSAIAKGAEVVVTRYEKGIAYVRLWSEIVGRAGRSRSTRIEYGVEESIMTRTWYKPVSSADVAGVAHLCLELLAACGISCRRAWRCTSTRTGSRTATPRAKERCNWARNLAVMLVLFTWRR